MKFERDVYKGVYDFAIVGLGYESRAVFALKKLVDLPQKILVLGYEGNKQCHYYENNKDFFLELNSSVIEGDDASVFIKTVSYIKSEIKESSLNVLVDISVLTRGRLGSIVKEIITLLPKGSTITFVYSLSSYVSPPEEATPVKVVGELCEGLGGELGNMSLPVSLVMGLGYEPDKAFGVSTFLDVEESFVFIPRGIDGQFETDVIKNNSELIDGLPEQNKTFYDVADPYHTYVKLKSLLLDLVTFSRPLLIPLGPKLLTVISVILSCEFNFQIPIWRVSSEHTETPVERPPSGKLIEFTITI